MCGNCLLKANCIRRVSGGSVLNFLYETSNLVSQSVNPLLPIGGHDR
jgi:hypothetical protein